MGIVIVLTFEGYYSASWKTAVDRWRKLSFSVELRLQKYIQLTFLTHFTQGPREDQKSGGSETSNLPKIYPLNPKNALFIGFSYYNFKGVTCSRVLFITNPNIQSYTNLIYALNTKMSSFFIVKR